MALISIAEYAKKHGRDPATAKQKAARGGFTTAVKIGRNWAIDENEPYTNLRHSQNRKAKPKKFPPAKGEYLDVIHTAIGGDYSDESTWVEDCARELAMRLDWYYNAAEYHAAADELIPALEKIAGAEDLCRSIRAKIDNRRPFNIKAIKEIVAAGYYPHVKPEEVDSSFWWKPID